ncbi:protein kinase [Streptomyces sp. NPDC052682]|uniref:serine/threonine-protein kinase n=1 Tax=Streptomyces sp. NPDC052682 TaxID=3154954 RepID=UPI003415047E
MATQGDNVRVIAGRYRLEARLGRGGMGVVWRATDQLLGRQVAVKELPVDETLSAEEAWRQRDRTLREARAVAQLRHPHIVVVHDVVVDEAEGERPYIVMELIDGGTLADRIATRGPVGADEAARIGLALLGALRAAHAAGVLHRDLKPANVLLEAGSDRVVLTDFGIAQVSGATTLTESGSFVGSPEYTAPERMSGARTGPASDLWSLGALLCAALSGETPFHRDSLSGVLHAVVVDEIRPPAQAEPLLPVVRGLLERDPDRRLDADAAERMLRAFRDTGRTPPVAPTGSSPTERGAHRRGVSILRDAAAWRPSLRWDGPGRSAPPPGADAGQPSVRRDGGGSREAVSREGGSREGGDRPSIGRDSGDGPFTGQDGSDRSPGGRDAGDGRSHRGQHPDDQRPSWPQDTHSGPPSPTDAGGRPPHPQSSGDWGDHPQSSGDWGAHPQGAEGWGPDPQSSGDWGDHPHGAQDWPPHPQDAEGWPPHPDPDDMGPVPDGTGVRPPMPQDAGGWPAARQGSGGRRWARGPGTAAGEPPRGFGRAAGRPPSEPGRTPGQYAADQHPTRPSVRGVFLAAVLVAAMAGAGVSAAALLVDRDGDGGRTPTSSAPGTPPNSGTRTPGRTATAPAPTVTVTRTPSAVPSATSSAATP